MNYSPVREMISVSVNAKTAGKFSMDWTYIGTGTKLTPEFTAYISDIPWDAASWRFQDAVNAYSDSVCAEVTQRNENLDSTGAIIGYTWTLRFNCYRKQKVKILPKIVGATSNTVSRINDASNPLSGSFGLTLNGKALRLKDAAGAWIYAFPVDTSVATIVKALLDYEPNLLVDGWEKLNKYDGSTFFLRIRNLRNQNLVFDINTSAFLGDSLVAKPTIVQTDYLSSSNDLFYYAIENELLFTTETSPQVVVTINDANSVCGSFCDFVTDSRLTPKVTAFAGTASGLSITLSLPRTVTQLPLFTVKFANVPCKVTSWSSPTLLCSIEKDANSNFITEAGSFKPIVHVIGFGYAVYDTAVNDEVIPPILTSITPSSGYPTGDCQVTITGGHFTAALSSLKVKFGANLATVISATSTTIVLWSPAGAVDTTVDVSVELNGQVQTFTNAFTYSDTNQPTITALSATSASPVLKGRLTITGTFFGTDANIITVYLDSATKKGVYKLAVVSVTDTSIVCILGGGKTGDYKVRIVKHLLGSNKPGNDAFSYKIIVSAVSPSSGSFAGGTVLTITGDNFSLTPNQNNVFIDDELNLNCPVFASTKTELKCIVPDGAPIKTENLSGPRKVSVQGRLIEEAICTGTCQFEYSDAKTPTITNRFYNCLNGDTKTIIGTGFVPGSTDVYFNTTKATVSSLTSTSITLTVPNIPAGLYSIYVNVTGVGNAGPVFNIIIFSNITGVAPLTGSLGGSVITISGSGFDPLITPKVTLGSSDCSVISWTPNQIIARTPGASTSAQLVKVIANPKLPLNAGETLPVLNCTTCTYQGVDANTPKITSGQVTGQTVTTPAAFSISVVGTALNLGTLKATLVASAAPTLYQVDGTTSSASATAASFSFTNVPAGTYTLLIEAAGNGLARFSTVADAVITVQFQSPSDSNDATTSSFAGGQLITLTGTGFQSRLQDNRVTACGQVCAVQTASLTQLTCLTPPLLTVTTVSTYGLTPSLNEQRPVAVSADVQSKASLLNDDMIGEYYDSPNDICYIVYDFGSDNILQLRKFEYFPRAIGVTDSSSLIGVKLFGSNDNTAWTELYSLPNYIHLGRNEWIPDTTQTAYRYYKIQHDQTSLPTADRSRCQLSEIKFYGFSLYNQDLTSISTPLSCPIKLSTNGVSTTLSSTVSYSQADTPSLTNVAPHLGNVKGGTEVTFTGTNFGSDESKLQVTIDGIACPTKAGSLTDTVFICTTQPRPNLTQPTLVIKVNGQVALNSKGLLYLYGHLFDDVDTWGGEPPPEDGDSIIVSSGQTLIINQSPKGTLYLIMVEMGGTLTFSDDKAMTLDAQFIIVHMGRLMIGLENQRYQNKLVITMHGNYFGPQLPEYGNKGIACHECILDIHGQQKTFTWTSLQATADVGATEILLKDDVLASEWQVGDTIVIASSDWYHQHAEHRVIKTYDATNRKITFDEPLEIKHFGDIETYSGKSFDLRAEVGLLSRNIVFRGDSDSQAAQYGAHILMHGSANNGLRGRISYAEFYHVGQPKIIGRYPIHFHMNGDVSGSYVIGNAIHDSFARCITLHAVRYLQVNKNVGFNAAGHNIFLEDGIEMLNTIEDNLMIGCIQSWSMLQADITPASYWITNPLNFVNRNHAGGSDFYGFWYELKEHPDGPSATSDVCPQGMPLGSFQDNVAHSNIRFGLRLFVHISRKYPCEPYKDEQAPDPWAANPTYLSSYKNFLSYKNMEDGTLAEYVGNMVFDNFLAIDNHQSGFNIHTSNNTREEVILQNSVIVGMSQGNRDPNFELWYANGRAVITPQTDNFAVVNVKFNNYPEGMTIFKSCSQCWFYQKWIQGGRQTRFKQIVYEPSVTTSIMIFWENWRKDIYFDEDGSLTQQLDAKFRYVVPFQEHLTVLPTCTRSITKWDNALICKEVIRSLHFANLRPLTVFDTLQIKIQTLPDPTIPVAVDTSLDQYIFKNYSVLIESKHKEGKEQFVGLFATSHSYNVHFQEGVDFTHMTIFPSFYFQSVLEAATPAVDDTVVIRFNYTSTRETFDIGKWVNAKIDTLSTAATASFQTTHVCKNGEFYHDNTNRQLELCMNGWNKTTPFEKTDITAVICRKTCPSPGQTCIRSKVKSWFVDADWIETQADGSTINYKSATNATIPCDWIMMIDQDAKEINVQNITIFGKVAVDVTVVKSLTIKTKGILIAGGGELEIGEPNAPYLGTLVFELQGMRNDVSPFIIDNDVDIGNKVIAVIGTLRMNGPSPSVKYTRLAASANVGDSSITLETAVDWAVGDLIGIAPTGFSEKEVKQLESFTISAISADKQTITLSDTIANFHMGGPSTMKLTKILKNNKPQTIDLRATVSKLNRNIRVQGSDEDNWGCRLLVTWLFKDRDNDDNLLTTPLDYRGHIELDGVEFKNCGQRDIHVGAIDLRFIESFGDYTVIQNSVIHHSVGYGMYVERAYNWKLTDNIFFHAKPVHLAVDTTRNATVKNNLFVGAIERDYKVEGLSLLYDPVMNIYWMSYVKLEENIVVTGNIAQGSMGPCLAFQNVQCSQRDTYEAQSLGFFDNQASTCYIGVITGSTDEQTCQWAGRVAVARSTVGMMINPTRPGLQVDSVISLENTRGIVLRFANEGRQNYGFLDSSYIGAVAYPTCTDCYDTAAKAASCVENHGVQFLAVTRGGEDFLIRKDPLGYDVVCDSESFDSSCFLTNTVFDSFAKTYSGSLALCSQNYAFLTHHGASDMSAGHYLTNTTCTNCQNTNYFYFRQPDPSEVGWFGGCGLFECTGKANFLAYDTDGKFFGQVGQGVPYNEALKALPYCSKVTNWNDGFKCTGNNLAILEFESIAPDFNKRSSAPVYIASEETPAFRNKINMFKEWVWDGPEPMNLRENIFIGVVPLNNTLNITFNGLNPYDLIFKIQHRYPNTTENNSFYNVIKMNYQVPYSIQVLVNDLPIKPYRVDQKVDLTKETDICGKNIYFPDEKNIYFGINLRADCVIRVRLLDLIKVSLRLTLNTGAFFDDTKSSTFTDRICSMLKVSTDRIRIVGVSTIQSRILEASNTADYNITMEILSGTTAGTSSNSSMATLNRLNSRFLSGISSSSFQADFNVSGVTTNILVAKDTAGASITTTPKQTEEQKETTTNNLLKDNSTLIILLSVIFGVMLMASVAIAHMVYKKRKDSIMAKVLPDPSRFQQIEKPPINDEDLPVPKAEKEIEFSSNPLN